MAFRITHMRAHRSVALLPLALALLVILSSTTPAHAAELPAYELDPTLSLRGECKVEAFDPIPDPSCVGEPPAYPAPPAGPAERFNYPRAIAVDSFGDEYVASYAESDDAKGRVDVFDDEGFFITEVSAPNAKSIAVDSNGNLYVFEDSGKVVRYEPSEYDPEAGKVAYASPSIPVATVFFVGSLAIDAANDHLVVAQGKAINIYKSAAEGSGKIESFEPAGIGDGWPEAIAVDGQRRRIYVSFCKNATLDCGVMVIRLDAPHEVLEEIDGSSTPAGKFAASSGLLGLAVDEASGDFFVADIEPAKTVYRFNQGYEYLSRLKSSKFAANIAIQIAVSNGKRSPAAGSCAYPNPKAVSVPAGQACNRHYLFVPVLEAAGRAIAFRPPAQTPPVIEAVSTAAIGEVEAELRARILPGGQDTEYVLQITTQAGFEAEGFAGAITVGEGTLAAGNLTREVSAHAGGLTAGQGYRYRALAENELGEAAQGSGTEGAFTTYDDAPSPGSCPNQALRGGASARLPDCRAYELVTPPETNGRVPRSVGELSNTFPTLEASPGGDSVWFKVEGGSLPGSSGVGSFDGDPYVARRGAAGWNSTLEGVSGDEATVSIPGSSSPDQGYSFWTARIEGPLVIDGIPTEYVRYPDGHSALIGRGSLDEDPRAAGKLITADGTHIVFGTIQSGPSFPIQLEPDAPPAGTRAVYDRTPDEVTHVVSLLPGDVTPAAGQNAAYLGASPDGEGIAFSIGTTLYLRLGNQTTYEIGSGVEFAGVSAGGQRIFYLEGGDLKAFDTGSEEVIDFSNSGDVTPVNVAEGGARAYFVSPSVLGGANPEGDTAQLGKQNLYLSEEGTISFIGTVTERDVEGELEGTTDGLGLWTDVLSRQPAKDPSRLNPDGSVLLFQSRAGLTGYDPGKSPQVFRYDSGTDRLQCISCVPTGVATSGGGRLATLNAGASFSSMEPLSPSAFVHNLSPDGKRAFFESSEALVSADTDGVRDVYEWEAQGVGSCNRSDGCVYLISSGQSARDNYLYAQSTDGADVFFSSEDRLNGEDPSSTRSIYDARAGGGFASSSQAGECLGEACQPVAVAPPDSSPASANFRGPGNVNPPGKSRASCPKGKRKVKARGGRTRCVSRHHRRAAGHGKGAGR